MSEYQRKLVSPLWQKRRLEIMQRDQFTCQFCGDKTEELHVHHVYYLPGKNKPWEYEDPYLVTVCHGCHADEENMKSEDPVLIGLFSMSGLSRRKLNYLAVELRRHFHGRDREAKFQDLMDFLANT